MAPSTTDGYSVAAIDPAKNASAQTATVMAMTLAQPIAPGNYITSGGYSATVPGESADGTTWLGSVTVNGVSVPTYWTLAGVSQNSAFNLP